MCLPKRLYVLYQKSPRPALPRFALGAALLPRERRLARLVIARANLADVVNPVPLSFQPSPSPSRGKTAAEVVNTRICSRLTSLTFSETRRPLGLSKSVCYQNRWGQSPILLTCLTAGRRQSHWAWSAEDVDEPSRGQNFPATKVDMLVDDTLIAVEIARHTVGGTIGGVQSAAVDNL